MKRLSPIFFLFLGLWLGNNNLPAKAQVYGDSNTTGETETTTEEETTTEIPPSYGTVPGIYYDPEPGLSPSLSQMDGTSESGSVETDYEDPNYNIERAWQRGSTPDDIVKVGDIEKDPELEGVIEIEELTLREIAANGGADIESARLKDIGLINSMTVGEYLQMFPEHQNESIQNVPIVIESVRQIDGVLARSEEINREIVTGDWEIARDRALEEGEKALIERLAREPMFENIPLEALAEGDWGELLAAGEQELLLEVMRRYPELAKAPINRLFPMINGAISRDWSLVVKEAQEVAIQRGTEILTRELIEAVPQLADAPLGALPIDRLLVGDIEGLADSALDRVPNIANRYLSELGTLSQTPGTMLAIDTAMILLTGDIFGRLDIPYAGEVETPITYVLSGGTRNQIFLPEPCLENSCKHFEVVDVLTGFAGSFNGLGQVQGKAWVQGSSQDVPGGKGFLRWVNNGKERTGVPVWTTDSHVKLSLEDIDEGGEGEEATARIWLNFQVCVYPPFLGEHCTPHVFSFATPWKVRSGGVMVVFSRSSPSDWVEYGRDRARDEEGRSTEDNLNRQETEQNTGEP